MNPSNPIQADVRWTIGRSRAADNLAPSFVRREMKVKRIKKTTEKPSDIAMKAGVVAVGAVKRSGALLGSADRSVAD